MSEELAHSLIPSEPPEVTVPSSPPPSKSPPPSRVLPASIAGGGSCLPVGDQPGDPFADLIVIATDGLIGDQFCKARPGNMPEPIDAALTAALALVDKAKRSVVVIRGSGAMTQACMTEVVLRTPGGLDSFGPGRKVERIVKEQGAEHGNLWEGALLVKMVAKRQTPTVRYGRATIVTSRCLAEPTLRVYRKCFEDWRVLLDGGKAHGGKDRPLAIDVEPIDTSDAALRASATALEGEAWYDEGAAKYAQHPQWPQSAILISPRGWEDLPGGGGSGGGAGGGGAAADEVEAAAAAKRQKVCEA